MVNEFGLEDSDELCYEDWILDGSLCGHLTSLTICDNCFQTTHLFKLSHFRSLESIQIGVNSFSLNRSIDLDDLFRNGEFLIVCSCILENLNRLKSVIIGDGSFHYYASLHIDGCNELANLRIGSEYPSRSENSCFYYMKQMKLSTPSLSELIIRGSRSLYFLEALIMHQLLHLGVLEIDGVCCLFSIRFVELKHSRSLNRIVFGGSYSCFSASHLHISYMPCLKSIVFNGVSIMGQVTESIISFNPVLESVVIRGTGILDRVNRLELKSLPKLVLLQIHGNDNIRGWGSEECSIHLDNVPLTIMNHSNLFPGIHSSFYLFKHLVIGKRVSRYLVNGLRQLMQESGFYDVQTHSL